VLSFTGSTAVGRRIGQLAVTSGRIEKTMPELGGNRPNRIIVTNELHDAFVERYIERVGNLKVGDPNHAQQVSFAFLFPTGT
jgi:aldehyde dehydrogenase (NAD+)